MNRHKAWLLFCEICNYRKVVKNIAESGLKEVVRSSIQAGIPKRNEETGQMEDSKFLAPNLKLKCPGCGRWITPKIVADLLEIGETKRKNEELQQRRQEEAELAEKMDAMAEQAKEEKKKRKAEEKKKTLEEIESELN